RPRALHRSAYIRFVSQVWRRTARSPHPLRRRVQVRVLAPQLLFVGHLGCFLRVVGADGVAPPVAVHDRTPRVAVAAVPDALDAGFAVTADAVVPAGLLL